MRIYVTGGSGFIGTHLIDRIAGEFPRPQIRNLDIARPRLDLHQEFWHHGDILLRGELEEDLRSFSPTHVVHLAARTDTEGKKIEDYRVNTQGSANFISALRQCRSVERVVFISTQYVVGPGPLPASQREHRPHTSYGASKCLMENMIWEAGLDCVWTIGRPTNIWGSWHPRYPNEFWRVLREGRYLHPGGRPVVRAYGYAGNVVDQVWKLLTAPSSSVDRKVFYLGDPPDDIATWVTAFSLALCGKKPRVVPRPVLRALALFGDLWKKAGYSFPLFSSRYRSMTQDYVVDMTPTYATLGPPRFTLQEGVEATVEWLKTLDPIWGSQGRREQDRVAA